MGRSFAAGRPAGAAGAGAAGSAAPVDVVWPVALVVTAVSRRLRVSEVNSEKGETHWSRWVMRGMLRCFAHGSRGDTRMLTSMVMGRNVVMGKHAVMERSLAVVSDGCSVPSRKGQAC